MAPLLLSLSPTTHFPLHPCVAVWEAASVVRCGGICGTSVRDKLNNSDSIKYYLFHFSFKSDNILRIFESKILILIKVAIIINYYPSP